MHPLSLAQAASDLSALLFAISRTRRQRKLSSFRLSGESMNQMHLFDQESQAASSWVQRAACVVASVPALSVTSENLLVQFAIDSGLWDDALALIRHKTELRHRLKEEMILSACDRSADLGEVREAVRALTDRIEMVIDGPVANEHVEAAKSAGIWADTEHLHRYVADLERSTAGLSRADLVQTHAAIVLLSARLALLRRDFH
jgi:hypothetical protein